MADESTEILESSWAFQIAHHDFYYHQSAAQTGEFLRIPAGTVKRLRKSEVYLTLLNELNDQLQSTLRSTAREDIERVRMAMAELVPKAIQVLRCQLDMNDGANAISAAREVLDRDGRLPKVSRNQTVIEDGSKIPEVSQAILDEFLGERAKPN